MVSISGLGSGLDTQSIIAQLVALEQQKIDLVAARATKETTALSSWTTIRSTLTTMSTAATSLLKSTDWQALVASSSDDTTATVSAGSGSVSGSLDFTVGALARAGVVRSANTITGLAAKITTDAALFIASGGGKLGFSSFASNDAVALGSHTIAVTQSSTGATKNGTAALAASTVVDGSNNALQIEVNGATYNLTLAAGTYDAQQLAAAVQTAATSAGAQANFTVATGGSLHIATASEGSAATLRVTGGTSLTALRLTTDGAVIQGTDGKLTVDGGATQTFGNTTALATGGTISIAAGGGTLTATLAGGLRVGSVTGNNVTTGDGSLQTIVAAINGAHAGVSAAAVLVGANTYRLQIASTTTGAGGDPNLAGTEFDNTAIGGLTVLAQGADASITLGSGAGSYSITSSSNTMSNLLPGVSVTLKKVNATPVTVTVNRDSAGLADRVQKLVDAANGAKQAIDKATVYDPVKRIAAPLTGDLTANRLRDAVYSAMSAAVAGANPGSPGLAGVSVDKAGAYTFDRQKFLDAYAKDPDGMAKVFNQWGSATSGSVSFVNASDKTRAGTYAVNVTQAATQAFSSSGGAIASGTTVKASIGSVIGSYTVQPGDTPTAIAAGLNSSFATQNLALVAVANGASVEIRTSTFGTSANMAVAWNGSSFTNYAGVNVAGTINGVAGVGNGQTLVAPTTDTTLAGLAIQVVGTTTGALGTITYTPGIAARMSQAITYATDPLTGYIKSTEDGHIATQKLINDQVDTMNRRLSDYEARLKTQYAALESAMGNLKNQQSWLAGQIASLG